MVIKFVISCWPSFKKSAQSCLITSLKRIIGDDGINHLSQGEEYVWDHKFENDILRFICPSSNMLSEARNRGAKSLSESVKISQNVTDCNLCVFVDSDTGFDIKNIYDIISLGAPVVGGYRYRSGIHKDHFVAGYWKKDRPGSFQSLVNKEENRIIKTDWTGGGFLVIQSWVFSKLKYPWFHYGVMEDGDEAFELSEDNCFCLQCYKAGIPILTHCGLDPQLIHQQDS
jgi:hypothetical protein